MSDPIRIPTDGGARLAATHFPATSEALRGRNGRPAVVMAHGLGATRDSGLAGFATALSAAGLDVVTFDYRNFAESDGTPRQLVSLPAQLRDYHAALRYARSLPEVDADRVAIWGVSLSGGHVLKVAAEDPSVAAVISLTPAVDGLAAVAAMAKANGPAHLAKLVGRGLSDAIGTALRRPPVLTPIVGHPGELAALTAPGAVAGMAATAGPTWKNAVASRLFLQMGLYRPGAFADRVRCPVLMQIADADQTAPPGAATRTATRLRATVHHYPCDHFDVYPGTSCHDRVVAHQVAFLQRVLTPVEVAS
ncbi:alpha/beta hydrolase [[Mycobacterium] burgundiense]|uniref:Alpha/beta hydrolase n=1 Tax=[Mycobacterium] burgundiense TaxID=3064286 RepID=A0ABM9LHK0_9MYCO|nr:alpha/beta hydrolase [Mycolicibacterium sp. MU0053]CAJ1499128.1 alpha/beta hydrolase [Mycolicibacterium sp. MU0053]